MKTQSRVLSLFALLSACLVMGHFKFPALNRYEIASKQCVLVDVAEGYGSGVCIRRTDPSGQVKWFVWTAAHVVGSDFSPKVEIYNRRAEHVSFPARVIAINHELDAALLSVEGDLPRQPAEFSDSEPPRLGDNIFLIGSPHGPGFFNTVCFGQISRVGVNPEYPGWCWEYATDQVSANVFHGQSGGPVFNQSGEVLGLVVGGVGEHLDVYTTTREIRKWCASSGLGWALSGVSCPWMLSGSFNVPAISLDWDVPTGHSL